MKIADIIQKNDKELMDLIESERRNLSQAVIESRTKEVKNVKAQAAIKRNIARALTIQRQREITNEEQAS